MADDEQKTLAPTDKRREDYRKDGKFAKARDAAGLCACAGALATLIGGRQEIYRAFQLLLARTHGDLTAFTRGDGDACLSATGAMLAALVGPPALASLIGAVGAGAAQAGVRLDTDMLAFKPERLNPLPRLQQLFSFKKAAFETALAFARVAVVGYVAYHALSADLPSLLRTAMISPAVAFTGVVDVAQRLVLRLLGALALLTAIDYAHSRFTLEQQMKMSLKEMKDEMRSQNGDPKVKARMRNRSRALARRRMMNDVKKASVVVTNPTHVAVALRYSDTDPAPIVVAKGHDEMALSIRTEARKRGIPILESRALARALDAETAVGEPISGAHYAAVAKVLAFVFRLRGRAPAARAVRSRPG